MWTTYITVEDSVIFFKRNAFYQMCECVHSRPLPPTPSPQPPAPSKVQIFFLHTFKYVICSIINNMILEIRVMFLCNICKKAKKCNS